MSFSSLAEGETSVISFSLELCRCRMGCSRLLVPGVHVAGEAAGPARCFVCRQVFV